MSVIKDIKTRFCIVFDSKQRMFLMYVRVSTIMCNRLKADTKFDLLRLAGTLLPYRYCLCIRLIQDKGHFCYPALWV